MNLDPDLQRILNINAKVYHVSNKRQGKVISVSDELIVVDYGNKAKPDTEEYDIDEFKQMLIEDQIVANHRLTMHGTHDNFKIKPRAGVDHSISAPNNKLENLTPVRPSKVTPDVKPESPAELGYINFSTGKFSTEPKKGYTKVEYKKCVEKVTLELTSEQLEELKEKGWVK